MSAEPPLPPERYPEPSADFGAPSADVHAARYLGQLENDLERALRRRSAPRSRRLLTVATAVVVLLALASVGLVVLAADEAPATVDIEVSSDEVVIRSTSEPVDIEAVVRELADAGVQANVTSVPTADRHVGRVVGWISTSIETEVVASDTDDDGIIDRVVVPAGFDGALEIHVGATDPLSRGRPPLVCEPFLGASVGDTRQQLADLFPDARWFIDLTQAGGGLEETDVALVPEGLIVAELNAAPGSPLLVFTRSADDGGQLVCDGGIDTP